MWSKTKNCRVTDRNRREKPKIRRENFIPLYLPPSNTKTNTQKTNQV